MGVSFFSANVAAATVATAIAAGLATVSNSGSGLAGSVVSLPPFQAVGNL